MERPTKELQTQNGHTAVLREWISAREYREIMGVYLKHTQLSKLDAAKGTADVSGSIAEATTQAQDLAVKYVVTSLDGKTENVVERVLDLPNQDAQEIMTAVEEVTNPKKNPRRPRQVHLRRTVPGRTRNPSGLRAHALGLPHLPLAAPMVHRAH